MKSSFKTSLRVTNQNVNKEAKQLTQNSLEIAVQRGGNSITFSATIEAEPEYERQMFEQCIALLRFELDKLKPRVGIRINETDIRSLY